MRYAVISDIHSNLEALEAVLGKIGELRVDETICLGDIVGYNAQPNECIELIKKAGVRCVMGNHDARAAGIEEPDNFTSRAKSAIFWTRDNLTEVGRLFLKELPRKLIIDDFIAFHGSINDIDRYILSEADIRYNLDAMGDLAERPRIGLYGHTHVKMTLVLQGGRLLVDLSDKLKLSSTRIYLVNPGSVGQPRDRDPRASFLIYDSEEETMELFRVPYDISSCRQKILNAGLPPELAERLSLGI